MKYLKFKTYLKTEGVDESSINKIIDYIKDFSLYGKRKPYTTTQEYGKQFEKQLEQLKQSNNYFNNAFVVKITSIKHFSWDNIKLKMQYFLREIEDYFRGSEYCIWFNAKTDIDYEVYICFDFDDKRVKTRHLKYTVEHEWYDLRECEITRIKSIDELLMMFENLKTPNVQENNKDLTWYLKSAKLFKNSKNFAKIRKIGKVVNFKLNRIDEDIKEENKLNKSWAEV